MVSRRRDDSAESLQLHCFGRCERSDCEGDALLDVVPNLNGTDHGKSVIPLYASFD